MTVQEFFDRSINWLREEQQLRTDVLGGSHLDDTTGSARLEGFFGRGNAGMRWFMRGLWVVMIGTIVSMMNLPGFTADTQKLFWRIGIGIVCVGVGFWGVAEVLRRRQRTRAKVELRAVTAAPTSESITALAESAAGAEAWCVSESPLDPDVLAAAKKRGIRCFVLDGSRFRDATA
jgi:hypothetical protein